MSASDTDVQNSDSNNTDRSTDDEVWKALDLEKYPDIVAGLVHFSAKTTNSNIPAGGIRLANTAGLGLPYVAARTLLRRGVNLDLDYTSNSGKTATYVKQIHAVNRNEALAAAATPEERKIIQTSLNDARENQYTTGFDFLDARLRQLLVPKPSASEGYVALTPLTASGLCHYLLDTKIGLVPLHNRKVKEAKELARKSESQADVIYKHIGSAQLGIGGSNPQNVGSLVRGMQRPIFVSAPTSASSLRQAFSYYYFGVKFSSIFDAELRITLMEYRRFRDSIMRDGVTRTDMAKREIEVEIMQKICRHVIIRGSEALDVLLYYSDHIPKESALKESASGEFEIVSRSVDGAIRGLIDPRLRGFDYKRTKTGREMDWPHEMAVLILKTIESATTRIFGEEISVIPLDTAGRNSLIQIIRSNIA